MPSVKATRRRACCFLATAPLLVVLAGCVDDEPATAGLTAADCPPVVLRPRDPHIASLGPDGTVEPGPACGTALCLAGSEDAFVYRDGDVIHAVIRGRAIEVPAVPTSPFRAKHAVSGVAMGHGVLVVDRGTTLEVYEGEGAPRMLPFPTAPEGATFSRVEAIDGGLVAWGHNWQKRERVMVQLLPGKTAAPASDAHPVADAVGQLAGWRLPGAPPAIVDLAGRRIDLPGTAAPEVRRVAGAWLVDDRNGSWVVHDGGPPITAPRDTALEERRGQIYAVPRGRRKKILRLEGDAWVTVFEAKPGHGLLGPLPAGALLERHQLAMHEGQAIVVERIRTETCEVDDRLLLLDLERGTGRVLASGARARLHPTWGGDRFRFVEAEVVSEMP